MAKVGIGAAVVVVAAGGAAAYFATRPAEVIRETTTAVVTREPTTQVITTTVSGEERVITTTSTVPVTRTSTVPVTTTSTVPVTTVRTSTVPTTVETTVVETITGVKRIVVYDWSMPHITEVGDQFNREVTDVQAALVLVDYGVITDKLTADYLSGSPRSVYDSVYIPDGWVGLFDKGYLAPLEDFITDEERRRFWVTRHVDPLKNLTDMGADGQPHLFSVPHYGNTALFVYRTDMVQEAGFDRPPITYEEVMEYGRELNKRKITDPSQGTYPLMMDWKDDNLLTEWSLALKAFGGQSYDPKTGEPTFNDAAGVDALTWMKDMHTEKLVDPASIDTASTGAKSRAFASGRHAMTWGWIGTVWGKSMDPNVSEVVGKVAVTQVPGQVLEHPFSLTMEGFAIPLKAENKDAAWKWIQFACLNVDTAKSFMGKAPGISPLKGVWEDPEMFAKLDFMTVAKEAWEKYPFAYVTGTDFPVPWFPQARDALNLNVRGAIRGDIPVQRALDDAVADLTKVAKEFIEKGLWVPPA
jgi:ABC-type glycerol-3-phosphate transport system substrate-binding protein